MYKYDRTSKQTAAKTGKATEHNQIASKATSQTYSEQTDGRIDGQITEGHGYQVRSDQRTLDRRPDRRTHKQTVIRHKKTSMQTGDRMDGQTHRQKKESADRQTDRQTKEHTDRKTSRKTRQCEPEKQRANKQTDTPTN